MGVPIKKAQAKKELLDRIKLDSNKLSQALIHPVSEGTFSAVVSFAYNLGFGAAAKVAEKLNSGHSLDNVKDYFMSFIHAGGVVNKSLVKRRKIESSLII